MKLRLTRNLGSAMCQAIGLRGNPKTDYVEGQTLDLDRDNDVYKFLDKQGLVEEVKPEKKAVA